MTELILTKTHYLQYREAALHLWATAHSLAPEEPPAANALHLMRQGQAVEPYARQYLEQVVLPACAAASLSWQPTLEDGPYQIRADALIRNEADGVVDLYEIKATTKIEEEHLEDAAFQALVAAANYPLGRVFLVHLNKEYVRGEELDPDRLFVHIDITAEVSALEPQVLAERERALAVMQAAAPPSAGFCDQPAACPCPAVCHPDLPEFSIYNIPRLQAKKRRELRAQGVLAAADVPPEYKLSDNQRAAVALAQGGQPQVAATEIQATLAGLAWPLWFLDYETFNPSVPRYPGYRPYQPIVFQFSLHVLRTPAAQLEHYEYLGTGPAEPAAGLVDALAAVLRPEGSVLVWNKAFEMTRNRELAEMFPIHAPMLDGLNARVFDLMTVFSQGLYQHPAFRGSASIKQVLPVLAPEFSYAGMPVSGGSEAMLAWDELASGRTPAQEIENARRALLEYCRLDTLAMVEIWRVLSRV